MRRARGLDMLETPVLIAGGGPVGMTLALELARYHVRSILVERNPTTTRHPKMDITNGRSMELFRRLGVIDALRSAGVPENNGFDVAWITSLNGYELHRFRYASPAALRSAIRARNDGSQGREPPLRVSQVVIEPVLKDRIEEDALVDVRFGTEFKRIVEANEHHVVSELLEVSSGKTFQVKSNYLAGCDGGGSQVRRDLGIKTTGDYNAARAFMVHFHSEDRALLQRWGIAWHYQTGSGSLIAQNDKDTWTLQAWILPGMDEAEMTAERVLEDWVGRPFDYKILQANPWGAHLVIADEYVAGRVALAGDSAHQYIPTGGYGMNSGICDAAGLGWVLAASLAGWGGPELLPAYGLERRATALNCLAASRRHMEVRRQIGAVYAEAGDLEQDTPAAATARVAAARRIESLGNAENESWGVEFGYRYDTSPLICSEPNAPPVDPLVYRGSTWPGARLPNVFLESGEALHDLLGLQFSLLALNDIDTEPLERAARKRGAPLTVLRLKSALAKAVLDRSLLLVRPDQHICWRGNQLPVQCEALWDRVTGWPVESHTVNPSLKGTTP
jgi:2-polyprenyl-6-methoxyphenol hydroxylase-like FAD-dependent oxidoreductase